MTGHDHLVDFEGKNLKKHTKLSLFFFLCVWGGVWWLPPLTISRCPPQQEEGGWTKKH
jgi:hypothetical protein